jgi:hypothetical protein
MHKVKIAALVVIAAVVVGALSQVPASPFAVHGHAARPAVSTSPSVASGVSAPTPKSPKHPVQPAARPITYPVHGTGSYATLPGTPSTIGTTGRLLAYRLVVEGGIQGIDRAAFARFVRETYGNAQGWTAGGQWRFRQVGARDPADFMLMLVTPATRDELCGGGYNRYTSCRIRDQVVLNIARWVHGVPNFGASLTIYRQYMINHETGHRLGRGHELCPAPGLPAPVMQQQTLGLHGCTAYAWPYLGGRRYKGRLGDYNDRTPAA